MCLVQGSGRQHVDWSAARKSKILNVGKIQCFMYIWLLHIWPIHNNYTKPGSPCKVEAFLGGATPMAEVITYMIQYFILYKLLQNRSKKLILNKYCDVRATTW